MRLLLIRHGETDWNVTLQYQGQANVPLNARGKKQSEALAQRLQGIEAKTLFSSDIVRAWQTAEILGPILGLKPSAMPEFREINVGQWEGLTPEELYRLYPDHMRQYERDPARTVRLGGESYADLQQRALKALNQIETTYKPDDTVIAVTHGGTIRALLCHVIGIDLGNFGRMWLDNASISEVRYKAGTWRLLRLNDTAHVENLMYEDAE